MTKREKMIEALALEFSNAIAEQLDKKPQTAEVLRARATRVIDNWLEACPLHGGDPTTLELDGRTR